MRYTEKHFNGKKFIDHDDGFHFVLERLFGYLINLSENEKMPVKISDIHEYLKQYGFKDYESQKAVNYLIEIEILERRWLLGQDNRERYYDFREGIAETMLLVLGHGQDSVEITNELSTSIHARSNLLLSPEDLNALINEAVKQSFDDKL